MRAVGVIEWGGPDALRVVDLPTPEAGPGQVRIRVHAAAVNPTDTLLRDGSRAERLRDVPAPHAPHPRSRRHPRPPHPRVLTRIRSGPIDPDNGKIAPA